MKKQQPGMKRKEKTLPLKPVVLTNKRQMHKLLKTLPRQNLTLPRQMMTLPRKLWTMLPILSFGLRLTRSTTMTKLKKKERCKPD